LTGTGLSNIRVITPNGGENLILNNSYKITWKAVNIKGTLDITLSRNGVNVGTIAALINPTLGTYTWVVGKYKGGTAPTGAGYKVVIKVTGKNISDNSDAAFTIIPPPPLRIIAPNGGEKLISGKIFKITWKSSNVKGTVDIILLRKGAQLGKIASGINPALNLYNWTVGKYIGGTAPVGAGYSILIKGKTTNVSDASDNTFSIL
jgi:hypothetical protein